MKALKTHLRRHRITQTAFARELGVSQPTVWAWLNGVKQPRCEHLARIADVTGISADKLLGRRAA